MDHFNYRGAELYAEDVPVRNITAQVGTPCYIYSRATLERHWHAFDRAFGDQDHLICYAVKANSNLGLLNILARLGSGFDIVSMGELHRVLAAGGDPGKVVFSGVGKTREEISYALQQGIYSFNLESESELYMTEQVARDARKVVPVAIRVNPDVDAQTHPYISTGLRENKFGIDIENARRLYRYAAASPHLAVKGLDCHIGSQLTSVTPFIDAIDRVLALIKELRNDGIHIEHLDIGGGLGIRYRNEAPPEPATYAQAVADRLDRAKYKIIMEPGRAIVGNAGILLTRVLHLKDNGQKHFAVVDAAMNDLIRPSLYNSWQEIIPVTQGSTQPSHTYDVVGPVCETGDFLGKERQLTLAQDDLLAVRSAGAYGFSMSSNYNSRPRVAEVIVDGSEFYVTRQRETLADLIRGESILPA